MLPSVRRAVVLLLLSGNTLAIEPPAAKGTTEAPTQVGQAHGPGVRLLEKIELVPGQLTVSVYAHDLDSREGPAPCWSYLTEGLAAKGQRELAFSLRRPPDDAEEAFPQGPLLAFLKAVLRLATEGRTVGPGAVSVLAGPPLVAGTSFRAVMYLSPVRVPGISQGYDHLTAILLTEDEGRLAHRFGATRVMARLGQHHR